MARWESSWRQFVSQKMILNELIVQKQEQGFIVTSNKHEAQSETG